MNALKKRTENKMSSTEAKNAELSERIVQQGGATSSEWDRIARQGLDDLRAYLSGDFSKATERRAKLALKAAAGTKAMQRENRIARMMLALKERGRLGNIHAERLI
jgi:hypothetical protein